MRLPAVNCIRRWKINVIKSCVWRMLQPHLKLQRSAFTIILKSASTKPQVVKMLQKYYREMTLISSGRSSRNCFAAIQRWNAAQQQKSSETGKKLHLGHQTLPMFAYQGRSTKDARLRLVGPELRPLLGRTYAEMIGYYILPSWA